MENFVRHNNAPACRNCGRPLRGRSDKLYCDVSCKNAYHNQSHRQDRREVLQIDRILKHNRKVLKKILGHRSKAKVSNAELIRHGLQFEFHTHQQTHAKNMHVMCCYEYGYIGLDAEKTLVIRLKKA